MTLHDAILAGLARAAALGLTKPDDVSFAIQVALDAAALKVIRQPGTGNFDRAAQRLAPAQE